MPGNGETYLLLHEPPWEHLFIDSLSMKNPIFPSMDILTKFYAGILNIAKTQA